MRATAAVLRLVPGVRAGQVLPNGGRKARRHYLDFQVDGVVLGEVVRDRAGGGVMADVVSVLVTDWPGGFPVETVGELLGEVPSSLPSGRVALYVCPECGSLGCGAVAARVERRPGAVVWRDLGWETSYDPPTYDPAVDLAPYADLGPFRFDAAQYEATLRPLLRNPPAPPAR